MAQANIEIMSPRLTPTECFRTLEIGPGSTPQELRRGCQYLGDAGGAVPRNLPKAHACFQKAKTLGYRGPAVDMLDAGRKI